MVPIRTPPLDLQPQIYLCERWQRKRPHITPAPFHPSTKPTFPQPSNTIQPPFYLSNYVNSQVRKVGLPPPQRPKHSTPPKNSPTLHYRSTPTAAVSPSFLFPNKTLFLNETTVPPAAVVK